MTNDYEIRENVFLTNSDNCESRQVRLATVFGFAGASIHSANDLHKVKRLHDHEGTLFVQTDEPLSGGAQKNFRDAWLFAGEQRSTVEFVGMEHNFS